MKLKTTTNKQEVETTEIVCEISQAEFAELTSQIAAEHIMRFIGDNPDNAKFQAGLALSPMFAELLADIDTALFGENIYKPTETKEEN